MTSTKKVVVIGAGHNGLVCGAYLAKWGFDVLIVERAGHVGGACITQELLPGYRFSTFAYGAHGPVPKVCRDLEIPAEAFQVAAPDPTLVQVYPDGDRVILWSDPSRTEAELARFGQQEVRGFRAYRTFCARALEICGSFFLSDPPDPIELRQKWSDSEHAPVLEVLLAGSLWDVISECFESEKVRMAFARADDAGPSTYPGSALAEFTESASSGIGVRNQSGILEGGMGQVTRVLAERVAAYGGRIRLTSPVRRIRVRGNRAEGVELESGEVIPADLVVSNADPKRTFLKLVNPEDLPGEFRQAVANLKTRANYMKFHAALNDWPRFHALRADELGDPRFASAARILPSLAYMEESWLEAQRGRLPLNPILSLQLPTAYWPTQAPSGKHTFGAWVRWAPARLTDGSPWEQHREEVGQRIIQIIDGYAPGFARSVEWSRLYTPADIENETGITDASIRHLDMTLDQMLHRRPLPAWSRFQTPVPGLWLCGSGTHPCGSVTGAPGHNCAAAIRREAEGA